MSDDARYLAVTDFETTGLDPDIHEIIQVARMIFDLKTREVVPDSWVNLYVLPTHWETGTPEARAIHNISLKDLEKDGVSLDDALAVFSRGVNWRNTVVTAWGTDFEMKFLDAAFRATRRVRPYSYRSFDVRSMAYGMLSASLGTFKYRGLADTAELLGVHVDHKRLHDAFYDVHLTCEVLKLILPEQIR
jgi:DNA polymerase III epsilon subunit-like protein